VCTSFAFDANSHRLSSGQPYLSCKLETQKTHMACAQSDAKDLESKILCVVLNNCDLSLSLAHTILNVKDFAFVAHRIKVGHKARRSRILGFESAHAHKIEIFGRVSHKCKRFCIWPFQIQNGLDFDSLDLLDLTRT
jgi:hypothetical protein